MRRPWASCDICGADMPAALAMPVGRGICAQCECRIEGQDEAQRDFALQLLDTVLGAALAAGVTSEQLSRYVGGLVEQEGERLRERFIDLPPRRIRAEAA